MCFNYSLPDKVKEVGSNFLIISTSKANLPFQEDASGLSYGFAPFSIQEYFSEHSNTPIGNNVADKSV